MAVGVSVLLLSISGTIWSWGLERGFSLWRCVLCACVLRSLCILFNNILISHSGGVGEEWWNSICTLRQHGVQRIVSLYLLCIACG